MSYQRDCTRVLIGHVCPFAAPRTVVQPEVWKQDTHDSSLVNVSRLGDSTAMRQETATHWGAKFAGMWAGASRYGVLPEDPSEADPQAESPDM